MKQISAPSNSTIEAPVEGVNRDPYREDSKRGNRSSECFVGGGNDGSAV
jgi:hypothetical protein